ncbi:hypothetical protein AB0Q95_10820 [Streptomyces sp. NPDC059900]|uniref:hypothetical protein n=1 Tax=Streptomyces sp. NPDC059900 TaxID=3155816 RepID=UPI0034260290
MTARSAPCGSRSVSRAGAALVVLLVTLVHLLACAHGPAPAGVARADSLPAATATCGAVHQHPTTSQAAPAQHSPTQCRGIDEPTVQPPRAIAPVSEVAQDTTSAACSDRSAARVHDRSPPQSGNSETSAQRERARLGVWRT